MKGMNDDWNPRNPRGDAPKRASFRGVCVHDVWSEAPELLDEMAEPFDILSRSKGATQTRDPYRDNAFARNRIDHLGLARRNFSGEETRLEAVGRQAG
jgi:hypothetical protein